MSNTLLLSNQTLISRSKRSPWLDGFRGMAICLLAYNHLHEYFPILSWTSLYTFESLGLFTMAEVIFFLSGVAASKAYLSATSATGLGGRQHRKRLFRRAGEIYLAHLLTILFVCIAMIYSPLYPPSFYIGAKNLPIINFFLGAVFLYQPRYLDVLPLYVLLLLALPAMLTCIEKRRTTLLLLVSALCWFCAQWWFWHESARVKGIVVLPVFHPLAWQAVFVLGLVLGHAQSRIASSEQFMRHRRTLVILCTALAIMFVFLKHSSLAHSSFVQNHGMREKLGFLRILNLLVVSFLCWRISQCRAKPPFPRLLLTIGRNSLWTFTWTLILTYCLFFWTFSSFRDVSILSEMGILLLIVLSIGGVAQLLDLYSDRKARRVMS